MEFLIIDFIILGFGGFFCLIWAAGIALRSQDQIKWIAVFFVGSSGYRLLWEAFVLSGLIFQTPKLYTLPIPVLYLIGPFILLYYERLSGNRSKPLHHFHFIPFLLSFLPFFIWFHRGNEMFSSAIRTILNGNWFPDHSLLVVWVIGPKISILMYTLYLGLRKSGEGALAIQYLPKQIQFFSKILLAYILLMILSDILGYLFGLKYLYRFSAWSHTLASILVYLYSQSNPRAMFEISGAIQTAKYARSKLLGIRPKEAILHLNRLIKKEDVYSNEDLRLATLATYVGMSSHQLSELVNVHFQMSVNQWINAHRILSACDRLEGEKQNILSIAYSVGFNSKSAFNRVFLQSLGVSPKEYRMNPTKWSKEKSQVKEKIEPKL
jgi:AraC-like DNA-binding protein